MPKTKVDQAQALRDVKASWESRGFSAQYLQHHQYEQDGDPYGELAYQRAFAEAAKKEPPRLPNPSHYPNSPSAQAFLQKRNNTFFNARQATADVPNPKYESPIPDYWRSREEARAVTPVQSQQVFMPPPPPPSQNGYAHVNGYPSNQSNGYQYATSSTNNRTLPSIMEPKIGAPMGPPSRLR